MRLQLHLAGEVRQGQDGLRVPTLLALLCVSLWAPSTRQLYQTLIMGKQHTMTVSRTVKCITCKARTNVAEIQLLIVAYLSVLHFLRVDTTLSHLHSCIRPG